VPTPNEAPISTYASATDASAALISSSKTFASVASLSGALPSTYMKL